MRQWQISTHCRQSGEVTSNLLQQRVAFRSLGQQAWLIPFILVEEHGPTEPNSVVRTGDRDLHVRVDLFDESPHGSKAHGVQYQRQPVPDLHKCNLHAGGYIPLGLFSTHCRHLDVAALITYWWTSAGARRGEEDGNRVRVH